VGEARATVANGRAIAEGLVDGRIAVRLGGRLKSEVLEPKYGVNRYAAPSPAGGFGVFSVPFTCPHSELEDRFVEIIDPSLGLPVPVEVPWGIWCHGTSVTLGEPHPVGELAGAADEERLALEVIEVFSRLGRPGLVIDAERRVRRSNGPAAQLIETSRLPVRDSVFHPGADGLEVLAGLPHWRGAVSDPFALRGKDETLLVQFMRLGRDETLVFVDDPAVRAHAAPESALRMLGLTAHESRIAAMVGSGRSPRETAVELGLSPHTVRSALKVVFDKLGVGRQSELARVVMRLETALAARSANAVPAPLGD
jgi:DNA-binding CsgD family transcriptional regulator